MKYNELKDLVEKLLSGSSSVTTKLLTEKVEESLYSGDITYSQAREISSKISDININRLTTFDNYNSGVSDLLSYYYEDYSETNYEGYDLDMKIERDTLVDIVEKIDYGKKFTSKEIKEYTSFLDEIKAEHFTINILNSLDYMISFIKANKID